MGMCSPLEMRKNLELVDTFRKFGIDFAVVPVRDSDHKNELIAIGNEVLEEFSGDSV